MSRDRSLLLAYGSLVTVGLGSCLPRSTYAQNLIFFVISLVRDREIKTRDLRIGRLRSSRIRIESGVTIRIRIESQIESAVYDI